MLIVFILIVTGLVLIVLPTLVTTVSELVSVSSTAVPKSINALTSFLQSYGLLSGQIGEQVTSLLDQLKNLTFVSSLVTPILSGLVSNVTGIFSNTMTLVMAFFFTLAILGSKEHLLSMTQKLLQAILPAKAVKVVNYIGEVIIDTYDRFLMSQIVKRVSSGFGICKLLCFRNPLCKHGWDLSRCIVLCALYWSIYSMSNQRSLCCCSKSIAGSVVYCTLPNYTIN